MLHLDLKPPGLKIDHLLLKRERQAHVNHAPAAFLMPKQVLGIRRGAQRPANLTAVGATLVAVFTHFMADEGAGCGTADGAYGATEDGIPGNAADHGSDASAHLGVGGVGCTTTQCQGRSAGGREKNVTDFHGEIP